MTITKVGIYFKIVHMLVLPMNLWSYIWIIKCSALGFITFFLGGIRLPMSFFVCLHSSMLGFFLLISFNGAFGAHTSHIIFEETHPSTIIDQILWVKNKSEAMEVSLWQRYKFKYYEVNQHLAHLYLHPPSNYDGSNKSENIEMLLRTRL